VEERDSGSPPARSGAIEVLHAPEHLHAPVTKRSAEHPMAGQENGLDITRDESASGWVFEQARGLDAHGGCLLIHC
jgi:hypothetical protein